MPFKIIRNDITKVRADAIVNTANPKPVYASGTDRAVYQAAGAKDLLAERRRIGRIGAGEAAVTPAFRLPARYIIHTVGPVWTGGKRGEYETLASCYRKSLLLARQLGCRSIAFPLISTGVYGFPKDKALDIALEQISSFLQDTEEEMEVILVVFDRKAFDLSASLVSEVSQFIDENYVKSKKAEEYPSEYSIRRREGRLREESLRESGSVYLPPKDSSMPPGSGPMSLKDDSVSPDADSMSLKDDSISQESGSMSLKDDSVSPEDDFMSPEERVEYYKPAGAARASRGRAGRFLNSLFHLREESASLFGSPWDSSMAEEMDAGLPPQISGSETAFSRPAARESAPPKAASPQIAPAQTHRPETAEANTSFAQRSLKDVMSRIGETFQECLLRLIDERGLTDAQVYKRANIDRKLFSKIRCNPDYNPKRRTAISLAIALELNMDETVDLLRKAGIALSPGSKFDLIISFCVQNGIYDIYRINAILFDYDQPLLGA